jgi:hypothetical protein
VISQWFNIISFCFSSPKMAILNATVINVSHPHSQIQIFSSLQNCFTSFQHIELRDRSLKANAWSSYPQIQSEYQVLSRKKTFLQPWDKISLHFFQIQGQFLRGRCQLVSLLHDYNPSIFMWASPYVIFFCGSSVRCQTTSGKYADDYLFLTFYLRLIE